MQSWTGRCLRAARKGQDRRHVSWSRTGLILLTMASALLISSSLLPGIAAAKSRHRDTPSGAIGLLLPDKKNSRWLRDGNYFVQRMHQLAPQVNPVVLNAGGLESTQIRQAKTAISSGAKVLIVAPVNTSKARAIVAKAHAHDVMVIAYDRPIKSPNVALYTGFSSIAVGKLQGRFIAHHVPKGSRLVFINGPADDGVARAQYQGSYTDVLKSPLKTGDFRLGGMYWTTTWSATQANTDMIDALFRNHGRVRGVVAANDRLASGVVAALAEVHVHRKVWVTGANAGLPALRRILQGKQSMTVYKPLRQEANAAAEAATSMLAGAPLPAEFNKIFNDGYGPVRAAIYKPKLVVRSTIRKTVIKNRFVSKRQLCKGLAKLCRRYHI